jgi:hypothetical protein
MMILDNNPQNYIVLFSRYIFHVPRIKIISKLWSLLLRIQGCIGYHIGGKPTDINLGTFLFKSFFIPIA